MSERVTDLTFKTAIVVLLLIVACLQFAQYREIRALSYAPRLSPEAVEIRTRDAIEVKVVNNEKNPVLVATPKTHLGTIAVDQPLAVEVKNSGLGDAIPVRIRD